MRELAMEHNQTEIERLKSEVESLQTLVSNLQALFKATLSGKSHMIHHLASAASGFWEIIQPDETIRYIDSAEQAHGQAAIAARRITDIQRPSLL
jgi:hypothetical protein